MINSVQQGIAAELDFQAIVDLVGDKLREVFATGDVGIGWLDDRPRTGACLRLEHGVRGSTSPMPSADVMPGGVWIAAAATARQTLLANQRRVDRAGHAAGAEGTDDEPFERCAVPMLAATACSAASSIENYEREDAFGDGRRAPARHGGREHGHRRSRTRACSTRRSAC